MKQIKPYNHAGVFFAENNIRSKIFAYSKSKVIFRIRSRCILHDIATGLISWSSKKVEKSQTRVGSHLKERFEVLASLVPLAPN